MKFTTVCSLIIVGGALGLTSSASAEPGSDMFGMPVRMPTSHSGPAFNPAAGASTGTSQPGSSSTSDIASSSGGSSSNGSGSSSNGSGSSAGRSASSNGFQHQNTNGASNFIGRGQEKVVEISNKDLATQTTGNHAKSEVTKKFEPSILDAGVDRAANSKASPKNPVTGAAIFAPIDPVTGVTIPPPPVPIPHTMVPEQAPAVSGINQIPSATVTVSSLPQALFAPIDPIAGTTIPPSSPISNGMTPH
jgi:hypothetical protein